MKNPFQYFKHLVKDPINNIAEANARKKEIMPWFIGSAAFGVLMGGLSCIEVLSFLSLFTIIGVVGIMFFGFLLLVVNMAKKRFETLTCDKCNTLAEIKTGEDFLKYISYTVVRDEAIYKGYTGNKEPSNGVYTQVKISASSSAVLAVDLTCPHCGEVKHLKYSATPFSCHIEKKNVRILDYVDIRKAMEETVKSIVDDYNDPKMRENIPYTFHSSKNPNFEKRYEFKGANGIDAHPDYMGARIDYHKDAEEMLLHYFIFNELSGTLSDPNKANKKGKKTSEEAPPEQKADSIEATEPIVEPPAACAFDIPDPEIVCEVPETVCEPIEAEAEPEVEIEVEPEVEVEPEAETESECEEAPVQESPADPEGEEAAPIIILENAPSVDEPEVIESTEVAAEQDEKEAVAEPTVSPEPEKKKQKKEKNKDRKSHQTLLIVLLSICAVLLIASGITIGILFAGQGDDKDKDKPKKEEETTEAPETTDKTEPLNVNDYVGYWYVGDDSEKELTIHSGLKDSATFSLWYYACEENEIKNMTVQLRENVADFSLAENGVLIKGTLTFEKDSITLEITQSTLEAMPAEVLEFTRQEATSERYTAETEDDSITEVYYSITVMTEDHYVYESPSYMSAPVEVLSAGNHYIVKETYDIDGNVWGELDSGLGWVCITDVEAYTEPDDEETSESDTTDTPEPELQAWQTAYLDYIETTDDGYSYYALIHVDDDSIPELYVERHDTAVVLAYKNGNLITEELSIAGGSCAYVEYDGAFRVSSGRMGTYSDEVYTLDESGFKNVFTGSRIESEPPVTDEYGNMYFETTYTANGLEVSEAEYFSAIEAVYDDAYETYASYFTSEYYLIVWDIENY